MELDYQELRSKIPDGMMLAIKAESGKIKEYNDTNNEGYDGYNPHESRVEELVWALSNYDNYSKNGA